MNDEETVALTAGGHTFGKAHGAVPADQLSAQRPKAAHLRTAGLRLGHRARRQIRRGTHHHAASKGRGRNNPTKWGGDYFRLLFKYDYELVNSPAGAQAVAAGRSRTPRTWRPTRAIRPRRSRR